MSANLDRLATVQHLIEKSPTGFVVKSDPAPVEPAAFTDHAHALAHARLRRLEHGGEIVDRAAGNAAAGRRE